MTDDRSLERAARSWLEEGPLRAPDRAVRAALARIQTAPQEPHLRVPWRYAGMRPFAKLAAFAVIGVVAIGGSLHMLGRGFPGFGGEPSPSPTATPTATTTAEPTSAPLPSGSTLPALRLPATRADVAGEYGWTGGLGSRAGMHNVIVEPGSPNSFRQTQLVFAVENDCFPRARGADPAPLAVAGLAGLYLEPYEDLDVQFVSVGTGTTGAYALPIGARTLCVYITWDPSTTQDELNAVRAVVESLRGQPFGSDGIRINFTLNAGWDVG